MLATARRIVLAAAGAAALVAASRARGDEWGPPPRAVVPVPVYQPPRDEPAPPPWFRTDVPAQPSWVETAPPADPGHWMWARHRLEREYRWLEVARIRFYRSGPWSPWQVRRFELWYQVRRAELDRRWSALAWAPAPREGWRSDRWHGRGWNGAGWRGDERWEPDGD